MPSTYTLNNGIELVGTGEQSGTWGDTTNTNFELLDTSLDGQVSVTLSATGSTGSPNTLPVSDGAASNGRNRLVIFGDSGDIGGTVYVQLTPNDAEKIIYVRNNLSGSRSILLFQGTYNASNDYEVPAGTTAVVFFNGAGSGAVAANVFNNAHFDALNIVGNAVVGGTLDVTGVATAASVVVDNITIDGNTISTTDTNGNLIITPNGTGNVNINSDTLAVSGAEGESAALVLNADEADDNPDTWRIASNTGNTLTIENQISGSTVSHLTITPNATVANSTFAVAGGLTTGGTVTANAGVVVDNITIDGTEIDLSSGDLTIDVAGDIILDAGGADISLQSGGAEYGKFNLSSNNLNIHSIINNADMVFKGNDNGSIVDALTLDMSEGGAATFNSSVTIPTSAYVGTSIVHDGDSNTSIDFAADQQTYFAGGVEQLEMTGSGGITVNNHQNANVNFIAKAGSSTNAFQVDGSSGAVTINEAGIDVDFRIEGNNNTSMFFLDGGNDRVGIGHNVPRAKLDIMGQGTSATNLSMLIGADEGATVNPSRTDNTDKACRIGLPHYDTDQSATALMVASSTSGANSIFIGGATSVMNAATQVHIYAADNTTTATGVSRVQVTGSNMVVNDDGGDFDFRVESDNNANAIFVDGQNDHVCIGTSTDFGGVLNVKALITLQPLLLVVPIQMLILARYWFKRDVTGANNDYTGRIKFISRNNNSQDFTAVDLLTRTIDASDGSEDATLFINTMTGGSTYNRLNITPTAVVLNEESRDVDFRVETDNSSATLFVDGQYDGVGIHTTSPVSYANAQAVLFIEDNVNPAIGISDTGQTRDYWIYANGNKLGIDYGDGSNTGGVSNETQMLHLHNDSDGAVFNEGGADRDFRVESDNESNMLFVDAGNNRLGIRTNNPASTLHIDSDNASGTTYGIVQNDGTANTNTIAGWVIRDGTTVMGGVRRRRDGAGSPIEVGNFASDATVDLLQNNERRITFDTSSNIVVNEPGIDADFRVESAANATAIFVDADQNAVAILNGTDTNIANLSVGLTGAVVAGDTDGATIGKASIVSLNNTNNFGSTDAGVFLLSGGTNHGTAGQISSGLGFFRESNATWGTQIRFYVHESATSDIDMLQETARFKSNEFVLNETSNDYDFRVETNGNANTMFIDAGVNRVRFGKNTSDNSTTNLVTIGGTLDTSWGASLGFENDSSGGQNGFVIATDSSWGIGGGFGMGFGLPSSDNFRVFMNSTETIINERSMDYDFRVESDGNANMLFVEAGANAVNIGKSTSAVGTVGFTFGASSMTATVSSGNTYHLYDTANYKFYVNANGGISNYQSNNVNLSDQRMKKNIEALDSQWDALKQWDLKKFHYKSDDDSDAKKVGVIAQDVQVNHPDLISDFQNTEDETRLAVKEQQMMWMAIKALQEAQAKIETLEAKVTALENA